MCVVRYVLVRYCHGAVHVFRYAPSSLPVSFCGLRCVTPSSLLAYAWIFAIDLRVQVKCEMFVYVK